MEQVIQKIMEDARKKVEEIENQSKEEVERIFAGAMDRVSEIEGRAKTEAEVRGRAEKERLLALAKVEMRKSLLSLKQKLSEEVFEKALESLVSKKGYQDWMMDLFQHAVEKGDEEVLIGNGERVMNEEFIRNVNEKIQQNGRIGKLRLATERREIKGGFILRRKRVEINVSLDTLLDLKRDELEVEVGKILFH